MKIVKSFIGAAAICLSLGFASCQGSNNASNDTAAAEGEATEAVEEAPATISEETIRPDSKVERLTVIDFNAVWCGPCKLLTPVFKAAEEKYAGSVDFFEIDIEKYEETAKAFNVQSVPTVVLIKPDGTVQQYVGTADLLPAEKFTEILEAAL
jgi:thioredoxin 1